MAPYDKLEKELKQFEKELRESMRPGCNLDECFEQLKKNYTHLANQADELLKIKQKIAREIRQAQKIR